jgi:hypothetical protein
VKIITAIDDIKNLENAIQELTSAESHISNSYSFLDSESIKVLMVASQLIISIANKKSDEMNKKILEEENMFKDNIKCQKTVRCFICGKMEYGGCPA